MISVNKIIKTEETHMLSVVSATILDLEEVYHLPREIRISEFGRWWVAGDIVGHRKRLLVATDGFVEDVSRYDSVAGIRPALILDGLENSDLSVGDEFSFGRQEFVIVSECRALCKGFLGTTVYDKIKSCGIYEGDTITDIVNSWFNYTMKKLQEK